MTKESTELEPYLMAVLAARVDSISRQMTFVYQRSARSAVMATARDLSTAICDANGDVLALPNGFPVHAAGIGLTAKAVMELHGDDFREGDAYLNNSPYHGNTHPADHTTVVPVFYEGELMFFCLCRGHQADIGNSQPTTYHAYARDIYEEGALIFPGVRVQREYKDVDDIIRMCRMRIRVPEQWYGDYLAGIGAARIGERYLKELIGKYGKETIKTFVRQWQEYGKRRMTEAIKQLPAGTWYNESTHDGLPGLVPHGITVKVKMTIDPEEGCITLDFLDNEDSLPCGLNLCEGTLTAAAKTGVLNHMPPGIPLCEGALSRIIVKMREGSVVGKAKHPFSSSVATTNVNDRAILAVQCAFNQVKDTMAMAEACLSQPASVAVISGFDSRYNRPFVSQVLSGHSGGGGVYGHDGYVRAFISNAGMADWNPLEIVEQKYPVLYLQQELITDSGGAGRWDGAPACRTVIATRKDPVTFIYLCDGKDNPPKGAIGGLGGRPARVAMRDLNEADSAEVELPTFHRADQGPNQALISEISAGGGAGDPLERDPERVKYRAREEWITVEKARDVYGVVLDTSVEEYAVDYEATEKLRAELRKQRGAAR